MSGLFFSCSYANKIFARLTHFYTHSPQSKENPDLARQPSALFPLSSVAPSDEPPVAASPLFPHHTLYLERKGSIQVIICLHISGNNETDRSLSLSFLFVLTRTSGSWISETSFVCYTVLCHKSYSIDWTWYYWLLGFFSHVIKMQRCFNVFFLFFKTLTM